MKDNEHQFTKDNEHQFIKDAEHQFIKDNENHFTKKGLGVPKDVLIFFSVRLGF